MSVGKRAVSIIVDEAQAVAKLIKPGDRVDVLAHVDYSGGRKDRMKVMTVLQDVLVLSTGLSITNSIPVTGVRTDRAIRKMNLNVYTNYRTVTLEVDPFDAQKLIFLISSLGKPFLSLRNNNDKQKKRIKSTELFDLLGEDSQDAKNYFLKGNN